MNTDTAVIPPEQSEQPYTSYEVNARGGVLTLHEHYTPAEYAALQAEIAERHAQGIYTLSEAVQILATENGLDTKALMLRMTTFFQDGKLTVRDPSLKGAPYLPGTKLQPITDWVYPHDVNLMLESWEVKYRFPQAEPVVTPSASDGVRWTPEALTELKTYRKKHGTKKAAEKFGITEQRIRQLLPGDKPQPKGYSAFTHRLK